MGTDIHLEAELQLDDGTWERIPHMPETCWSCGTFDRETGTYRNATGMKHVFCRREEMLPDDVILEERDEWVRLERMETCGHCNGTKLTHPQFFKDRNYDVFAILGNVRNGYGFAGTPTSTGFEPISDCRGLPEDLSPQVLVHMSRIGYTIEGGRPEYSGEDEETDDLYEELERERDGYWSLGDHSFSHLLLSEIEEYDWDRAVIKEGWVDPGEFERFRREGQPRSWAGGVAGGSVEHISDTEMGHRIDTGDIVFEEDEVEDFSFAGRKYSTSLQRAMGDWDLPEGSVGAQIRERNSIYCLIKWPVHYRECVGAEFWQQVEHLKALAPEGDLNRVRLVFGFDS